MICIALTADSEIHLPLPSRVWIKGVHHHTGQEEVFDGGAIGR